jgi:dCMP deaminase
MPSEILQSSISWDNYFLNLAEETATKSKDPSTKVGCIIVDKQNRIRSTGYNGFPSHVKDFAERYEKREQKLFFVEHAEKNAVYYAARLGVSLDNCKLYVRWHPCHECSKAIIQSGINEVIITNQEAREYYDRWRESIAYARIMLDEAGVSLRRV